MKKKLLIVLNDSLSDIIEKGEVVKRYYNPKNYFNEIHFILINQNKIKNLKKLKMMTGKANIYINYLNLDLISKISIIFNFFTNYPNINNFYNIVKRIQPNVIRCYNINYPIFLSYFAKIKFGIPYIISLHTCHEDEIQKLNIFKKIVIGFLKFRIKTVFVNSYKILPVYKSAEVFLKKMDIKKYETCYNFIGRLKITKTNRLSRNKLKLICTNRQYKTKNPINIIKAVENINNLHLTLVGDGVLHESLQNYVIKKKLKNKITFIKRIPNMEYLKILYKNDILIINTDMLEFGKSVIEAMSLKKPVIINRPRKNIFELNNSFCLFNSNSASGYKKSILKLLKQKNYLKKLGNNGFKIYKSKYESRKMELKHTLIYRDLINKYYKN